MLAMLSVEVPSGTEVVVHIQFRGIPAATPPAKAGTVRILAMTKSETIPLASIPWAFHPSPRGPQLWLRYPGWECDAAAWRPLGA